MSVTEPAPDTAGVGSGYAAGILRPPFTATALNHLLRRASWARGRFSPHAGKIVRFDVAPFTFVFAIRDTGEVADARSGDTPDLRIAASVSTALRALNSDQAAWKEVRVEGDAALSRDILYVAQNLGWDVEEDLSRIFGDVAAHRIAGAGRDLWRWQQRSAEQLAKTMTAYWTEEKPLIATRYDVETFVREVDALRDDVARIEKRLALLEQTRQPK